jgi:hypothetical protein
MKHLLPLTKRNYGMSAFEILDTNGKVVGFHLTKDEAEFLVTAANAYYGLLELAEDLLGDAVTEGAIVEGSPAEIRARNIIAQAKPGDAVEENE